MTDFPDINAGRAEKIVGFIEMIAKSARSQRPSAEEITETLSPVIQALDAFAREFGAPMPPDVPASAPERPAQAPSPAGGQTPRAWADAVQMAREAPLGAAAAALGVIATRLEQEIWEREN